MKKKGAIGRLLAIKGVGSVLTAFIGLIVIYVAFGIMNPKVFSIMNIQNLLRSMSKYLLIGVGQSFVMITGNIDLSIGSVVGMSAMISATLMSHGTSAMIAIPVTIICGLIVGLVLAISVNAVIGAIKRKNNKEYGFPMLPYLAAGFFAAYFI